MTMILVMSMFMVMIMIMTMVGIPLWMVGSCQKVGGLEGILSMLCSSDWGWTVSAELSCIVSWNIAGLFRDGTMPVYFRYRSRAPEATVEDCPGLPHFPSIANLF